MSTALYGIRILDKASTTLVLRVFAVYPGLQEPLPSATDSRFFLLLLHDAVVNFENPALPYGARTHDVALNEMATLDQLLDARWCDDTIHRFIASIESLAGAYTDRPCERADDDDHYDDPQWEEREQLPQMIYRLTVTAPSLIAHIVAGDSWGTTAFP